jgi:hypothetical protein
MKADEWLYLCVAHGGGGGAMEASVASSPLSMLELWLTGGSSNVVLLIILYTRLTARPLCSIHLKHFRHGTTL